MHNTAQRQEFVSFTDDVIGKIMAHVVKVFPTVKLSYGTTKAYTLNYQFSLIASCL